MDNNIILFDNDIKDIVYNEIKEKRNDKNDIEMNIILDNNILTNWNYNWNLKWNWKEKDLNIIEIKKNWINENFTNIEKKEYNMK